MRKVTAKDFARQKKKGGRLIFCLPNETDGIRDMRLIHSSVRRADAMYIILRYYGLSGYIIFVCVLTMNTQWGGAVRHFLF